MSFLPKFCKIFGQTVLRLSAVGHQQISTEVLQKLQANCSEDLTSKLLYLHFV